jgi:hypothetical protein
MSRARPRRPRPVASVPPAPATAAPPDLDDRWHAARARWSLAVELKRPLPAKQPGVVACIDLQTRQTWVDFALLAKHGLEGCLEALCAHEVGHHIRYPNTLLEAYRLTRFLREELVDLSTLWGAPSQIPRVQGGQWDFLLNLVFDLLINTDLKADYQAEFVALYRHLSAEPADPDVQPDALFGWYMGLYEEGWYLPRNTLVGPRTDARLTELRPGWRVAAAAAFQHIRANGGNRCLQITRFLFDLEPLWASAPAQAGCGASIEGTRPFGGELSADDARRVMQPSAGEAEARRWRRGEGVGPAKPPQGAGRPKGSGGLAGRPGVGEGDPIRTLQDVMKGLCEPAEVALTAYRRMARRVTLDVPRSRVPGESDTPGPTEPWLFGDRVDEIDWLSTLVRSGRPVPGLNLEKRTWLVDEPRAGTRVSPWIELYVDCSGSMPDPVQHFNFAILAGFILANAALENGGRVRVISYSHEHRAMPDFVTSERHAHAGLLTYVGGGTRFPWDVVYTSHERWRRAAAIHRVVISDSDFLSNFRFSDVVLPGFASPDLVTAALAVATRAPHSLVLLLQVHPEAPELKSLRSAGAHVVTVGGWADLPAVARDLVKILFPAADSGSTGP